MKWVLATAGGWLLGSLANVVVINLVGATGLGEALNATSPDQVPQSTTLLLAGVSLVLLLIVGFAIGFFQWMVLRQQVPQIRQWALFTALGFALGSFAMLTFMGLGVGLAQWLLLRRELSKTGWWPVINAVAWPLAYMFGGSLGALYRPGFERPVYRRGVRLDVDRRDRRRDYGRSVVVDAARKSHAAGRVA